MKTKKQKIGDIAEGVMVKYAKRRGWKVIARNWRKPWGEIDLVARDGVTVLFIEVKAQEVPVPDGFAPEDHFTFDKAARVVRTAHSYLLENNYDEDVAYRIDLAAVEVDRESGIGHVRYYPNAIS